MRIFVNIFVRTLKCIELSPRWVTLYNSACFLDLRLIVPRHGTYWRLDERLRRVEEGYPLQVGDRWAGIPDDIDAAFTYKDGK